MGIGIEVYKGNAVIDGGWLGGWFVGNKPEIPQGLRCHKDVFLKYGLHHRGQESEAHSRATKTTIAILIEGGPFVHSFETLDGTKLEDKVLEKVGDYIIYGPDVNHTWKALKESTVLTVQFPP